MLNTLKNFQDLSKLYTGTKNLDQSAIEYQSTNDPVILAYVFVKSFPLIVNQANKYFYLTESDKASYAVEELHRSMIDFEEGKGAKIQTFFSRYLNNRLRAETQALNMDKRKSNNASESYEAIMEIASGYFESGYDDVEFTNLLETSFNLSENELKYCKIVMTNTLDVKDSDIARVMGITPAAVHYMKKSLAKKFMCIA